MKVVICMYLLGFIPSYLSLRHAFIRLTGEEGKTIGDAVLTALCILCSWIAVVVSLLIMAVLEIEEIDQRPANEMRHPG